MSDLISRQAAIDALDDEITITGKTNAIVVKDYVQRVKRKLEQLPSAQPEIIRCKDCKHFEQDIMNPNVGVCCHDGWVDRQYSIGFEVNGDGFCSRAEPKGEQEWAD